MGIRKGMSPTRDSRSMEISKRSKAAGLPLLPRSSEAVGAPGKNPARDLGSHGQASPMGSKGSDGVITPIINQPSPLGRRALRASLK